MNTQRDSAAAVDQRLLELADLHRACRAAFLETANQFHWTPGPGSVAALASAELPSPDPAIADPQGETGHRLIAEVVQTYLLAASGHLGGLASLYATNEVFFSPPALIRATIENCAQALWVLGSGVDELAEERLARAYLQELLSAEEAKKNAGRMHRKSHPSYKLAKQRLRRLEANVRTRFAKVEVDEDRKWAINDLSLPGPGEAVAWMYELTKSMGGTISRGSGAGIYGFLSNKTHPTLYPARQWRVWEEDQAAGHHVAYLRADLDVIERESRAALAAFYNALTYVTSYFDWPDNVLDELNAAFEESMPTFFLPES